MTLHLSYEIIFHDGGLKLAVIDIASSRLKVIQFFLDNRKTVFYLFSGQPLGTANVWNVERADKILMFLMSKRIKEEFVMN